MLKENSISQQARTISIIGVVLISVPTLKRGYVHGVGSLGGDYDDISEDRNIINDENRSLIVKKNEVKHKFVCCAF
jgi:hypothetical protein